MAESSSPTISKRFNVLTAEFLHETNTFCKIPTNLDSFRRQWLLEGSDEVEKHRRGTRTALGATFEAADRFNWNLKSPASASSNPSGKVETKTFEHICDLITREIFTEDSKDSPPAAAKTTTTTTTTLTIDDSKRTHCCVRWDGILLHLHGAMVTEDFDDAEGELLRRIRDAVGDEVPIVVTLDLHGNISDRMAALSSSLIAVRTYPHIDFYERAQQGAALLQRAMRRDVVPRNVIARRPQLRGLDGGKTQPGGPMSELIQRGMALEERGDILAFSVCAGFTAADINETGPSVTITYDAINGQEDASAFSRQTAEAFMDLVWETRRYVSAVHLSVSAAIERAKIACRNSNPLLVTEGGATDTGTGPLVIAEVTDNPGSGHYGDATNLLRAMVDANLSNAAFYAIYDPQAVQQGKTIGVGNEGIITLGGKTDPAAGGRPLTLTGRVATLSDGIFPAYGVMGNGVWMNYGLSMLFRVGGVEVMVISNNGQCLDLAQLTSLGCDVRRKAVVVIKSAHHFRAAFAGVASDIVTCDGGGLGSVILHCGEYRNVRRPIWPLDKELETDTDTITITPAAGLI